MNRFTSNPSSIDVSAFLLDDLKTQLKIIGADRDAQLSGLLVLSADLIERYTWRYLTERTVKGEFNSATPSRATIGDMLDCQRAPVFDDSLLSITFKGVDSEEALTGFIAPVQEFGECFITSEPEQAANDEAIYPIVVEFKAGYPLDGLGAWTCPEPLKQAIVSLAMYMYANPLDCGSGGCNCAGGSSNGVKLPSQVSMMVSSYVIRRYDHALYL